MVGLHSVLLDVRRNPPITVHVSMSRYLRPWVRGRFETLPFRNGPEDRVTTSSSLRPYVKSGFWTGTKVPPTTDRRTVTRSTDWTPRFHTGTQVGDCILGRPHRLCYRSNTFVSPSLLLSSLPGGKGPPGLLRRNVPVRRSEGPP